MKELAILLDVEGFDEDELDELVPAVVGACEKWATVVEVQYDATAQDLTNLRPARG